MLLCYASPLGAFVEVEDDAGNSGEDCKTPNHSASYGASLIAW